MNFATLKKILWWMFEPTDEREEALFRRAYKFSFLFLVLYWFILGSILTQAQGSIHEVTGMAIAGLSLFGILCATMIGWITLFKEEISDSLPNYKLHPLAIIDFALFALVTDNLPRLINTLAVRYPYLAGEPLLFISTLLSVVFASITLFIIHKMYKKQHPLAVE